MLKDETRMMILNTSHSINQDKKNFELWRNNQITTGICLERFREANSIPYGHEIKEEDFIEWLEFIGYKREIKIERYW